MKKLACVIALGAVFLSNDVLAWGADGHRAVGAIADKLIKGSRAEQQVNTLLLPGESLESVANWADCVKGTYCGAHTPEMQAYVAANPKGGEYHYTDVPFQKNQYRAGEVGTAPNDIVQTLKQAIAVLQGKTDPALNPHGFTKRQALLLITHMSGDIHQPLHVGAAFVSKDGQFVVPNRHSDIDGLRIFDSRGGNNFLVDEEKIVAIGAVQTPGENQPAREAALKVPSMPNKPFHAYWDSTVVNYAMRRLSARTPEQFAQIVIASAPVVAKNTGNPATWPAQWADDALVVAKLAYKDVTVGPGIERTGKNGELYYTWNLEVPPDYPVPSSAIAKTQLTKAGYHLAALLQRIWS